MKLITYWILAFALGGALATCGPKEHKPRPGHDGGSCSVTPTGFLECEDGSTYQIPDGQQGDRGSVGPQGPAGTDARNPGPGDVGIGGLPPGSGGDSAIFTRDPIIVEIVDPCGPTRGHQDEVLLRLDDGTVYLWLVGTHIRQITPGTYRTADKQKCRFTVAQDGAVTW